MNILKGHNSAHRKSLYFRSFATRNFNVMVTNSGHLKLFIGNAMPVRAVLHLYGTDVLYTRHNLVRRLI